MSGGLPFWIRAWLVLDFVLALAPPLHWAFGVPTPVGGVPGIILYLFGTCLFVAASVVVAYLAAPGAPKTTRVPKTPRVPKTTRATTRG